MPESPTSDEEQQQQQQFHHPYQHQPQQQQRRLSLSSMLEPPVMGFKRLWSRRRSSFNPNLQQLTLSHYLTKEVVPNLDNYRMTVGREG